MRDEGTVRVARINAWAAIIAALISASGGTIGGYYAGARSGSTTDGGTGGSSVAVLQAEVEKLRRAGAEVENLRKANAQLKRQLTDIQGRKNDPHLTQQLEYSVWAKVPKRWDLNACHGVASGAIHKMGASIIQESLGAVAGTLGSYLALVDCLSDVQAAVFVAIEPDQGETKRITQNLHSFFKDL